jgi:hypothetical protein
MSKDKKKESDKESFALGVNLTEDFKDEIYPQRLGGPCLPSLVSSLRKESQEESAYAVWPSRIV